MAGSGGWRAKRLRRQVQEVASEAGAFERRGVDAAPARCADALLHDYDELRAVTVAEHLRAIAQWLDEAAAHIAAQAQQIEAKHGHVFRTAHLITGEHYTPYMDLHAAPERIQRARRLRDQALVLARKQDRRVRRGADLSHVETLHAGKDTEGLIKALRDPKPKVRIQAAKLLGELGDPAAVEPLIALLDDNDELSVAAADALGAIGDRRATEPLLAVIHSGRWVESAALALGRIGDPRALDPLLARLDSGSDKNAMAAALAMLGDKRAIAPMREILAKLRVASSETDVGRRLNALFIKSIEEAINKLDELGG